VFIGQTGAMRVERYFAFVDLCGFTSFVDAQGDESSVAVLHEFRSVVRHVASDHGVRVAKWLGDGAMFVSPEPTPLLATIVDLDERVMADPALTLPLRTGVAGGLVIVFEGDDYIGKPVNLAARLCDVAEPNEILAEAALIPQLPGGVDAAVVGDFELPGFQSAVPVVRLGARSRQTG
jgi:adenylate cyclase